MNKTVDTRICEVTAYNDQALVTRRGVVRLTGEEYELIVAQLPATLISESVRVKSVGAAPVTLLGVRTERSSASEAVAQNVDRLTQEMGNVEEQKRQGQDLLALLNLQRNFIKSLSTQYLERLAKFPDAELLDLHRIGELLNFVEQQYGQFSKAIATSEQEQRQLDKQLQELRQELHQLSNGTPSESFNIIVTIEPSGTAEIELEVSYVVPQVSWMPLYDLRLEGRNEKIGISYFVQVKQNSGEDWSDVALTLSTAKPGLGTLLPELSPWYIDVQNSIASGLRANNVGAAIVSPRALSAMPFPGMTPVPDVVKEVEVESSLSRKAKAEVSQLGGIVTFEVSNRCHIPGDGTAHKTTIFTKDYPCLLEYLAVPRLMNFAYLQTTIANPSSGVTLLPGKAHVFRDNTFVGTAPLENVAPGQEFKLNLGIDEGVKIERDLVERLVDYEEKELVGNLRRTTYGYRIAIANLRDRITKITLIEQLPVARSEQIEVNLTHSNPQAQIGEMGILEWSLTLLPLSTLELYYQFTVEHPPELTIFGLDI